MASSFKRKEEIFQVFQACNYDEFKTGEMLGLKPESVRREIRGYRSAIGATGNKKKKKVLIFDIETAPYEGYFWDRWKVNIPMNMVKEEWSILCWAAKWLDGTEIMTGASWLDNDNVRDDKACCLALSALLDEADIVVAHNGDKFDIKRVNTRLLLNGLKEPQPFKSIDTYKVVKSRFCLPSNRLDDVGQALGVGRKVSHQGFSMWEQVLKGNEEARKNMLRYNVGDITLLEQVYLKVRQWDKRHPNINIDFGERRCPVCASEDLELVGDAYTNVSTFAALECKECGKYSRTGYNKKSKEDMQLTQRNIV